MNTTDYKNRLAVASKLLLGQTSSIDKLLSLKELISGIDARIDQKLKASFKILENISHLEKGEFIELTATNLPEKTEEEKKRKKVLILFIKSIKALKGEIERVKNTFETPKDQQKISDFAKIFAFPKGPFGAITAAAIVIVSLLTAFNTLKKQDTSTVPPTASPSPTPLNGALPTPISTPASASKSKIQVIIFNNHKIPLSELAVRTGPDCTNSPREIPHYHAKNGQSAISIDGTVLQDPGTCAFGKVNDTPTQEVDTP